MAENTTRDTLIHYIFDDVDDDDDYLYSANNKRVIDSDNNESYEYETHTPSPKRRSPTRGDREEKSYASRLDHLKRKRRDLEEFIQRKEREKRYGCFYTPHDQQGNKIQFTLFSQRQVT
eukprot:GEZU01009038.1.p1 GENE.GEZU01009038.1~~GEZU01009038.1.p1  ORF type:complete len:119 (-),score=19.62 GEZU01009038.1:13-369(-)